MQQTKKRQCAPKPRLTAVQQEARDRRDARNLKVRLTLGYAIVAVSVVLGFLTGNVAVGIGLAVLAMFRLLILMREVRRQG